MEAYDYQQFFNAWVSAHSISTSNKVPDNKDVSKAFDLLSEYPITAVIRAIDIHSKSSRFPPTPADICAIIDSRCGNEHIGSDEAWTIVLSSFDEDDPIVMTDEIFEARVIAYSVWLAGDKIGTRMAFKDAYERIVKTAGKPKWRLIVGNDKSRSIEPVLKEAVRKDRLTQDEAAKYLPAPLGDTTDVKLLPGETVDEAKLRRANIRRMVEISNETLKKAEQEEKQRKAEEAAKKRQATEQRRQELLAQAEMLQTTKFVAGGVIE
jgi:hypothetical protein